MQVSTQNSLTWLQTTPAAVQAANQISSSYGQVSPGDDASGADAGQAAISGLQSPAQMFAPASLNALVSSQSDDSGSNGAASTATSSAHHHHHHHGGAPPTEASQADAGASESTGQTATTATAATATASTDASAQADLSDILMNL